MLFHRDPNIGDGQEKGEERQFVDKNQSLFQPLCTFFVSLMAPPTAPLSSVQRWNECHVFDKYFMALVIGFLHGLAVFEV